MHEIRLIQKKEFGKIQDFNKQEYRPDHILANKIYYDWQFDDFANSDKDRYTALAVFDEQDDILGTIGFFPSFFNFFGKRIEGVNICNLMIKEKLRNLGFGLLLLDKAVSYGALAIDHGINEKALPLFKKSGWKEDYLKRFVYVFNPAKVKELIGRKDIEIKPFEEPPESDSNSNELRFEEIKEFGKDINEFWNRKSLKYPISVERSQEYLNWRYAKHPLFDYKIFVARDGRTIKSFAVFRIEKPLNYYKAVRLVDFVSDEDAEEFSLASLLELCYSEEADFIDYFSSGQFHIQSFKKLGFVDSEKEPLSFLPMLLNPIDRVKRTKINFAVKRMDEKLDSRKFSDLANWYTTKAGGDQDRPN